MLKQDGPVFATLRVEPIGPLNYDYPKLYDPARRKAIKDALQGVLTGQPAHSVLRARPSTRGRHQFAGAGVAAGSPSASR